MVRALTLSSKKRLYVGAHRQNFTGSLLTSTDVKVSSCRYWALPLENEEILSHALDPKNFGVFNANKPVYPIFDRGDSGLIKTIVDANKDLLELQRKVKLLKQEEDSKPQNVTNALFVGSTTELQKLIKKNKDNIE